MDNLGDRIIRFTDPLMRGSDVQQWQEVLIEFGFGDLLGSAGADGYFGQDTRRATVALQASLGIVTDGIIGSGTIRAVEQARANDNSGIVVPPVGVIDLFPNSWDESERTLIEEYIKDVVRNS